MGKSIRGLVYDRYRSIRIFAEALGWDRTKTWNIVNGAREPRVSELQDLSRVLEVPVEELAGIFLR